MLIACLPAVALLTMTVLSMPRITAQEPGTPPETAAPSPDSDTPAPEPSTVDPGNEVHPRARPSPGQPAAAPAQDDAQPAAPAAPELPKWPVNELPGQARVTWDSHGLSVDAANSSLQQILKDISTATGATVEGANGDERVFGAYGPGQARDVLSQLLLGAGYNVIMIGDLGQGAPRQILLSSRHSSDSQATPNRNGANNNDDDSSDNDVDEQPVQPQPPMRPGFPGGPPRTPQQMMQERMQQRQQMIQQQQQQPNNQPNNPPN
jgi:hypothetical protein